VALGRFRWRGRLWRSIKHRIGNDVKFFGRWQEGSMLGD